MGLLGKIFGANKNNSAENAIDFYEIKNDIYPWAKKSFSESFDETAIVLDMPEKALIADLIVLFVVDRGDIFHVLQQEDIPADITIDDLYALAVKNLQNNITFRLTPAKCSGVYGLLADGNHEAGALCLDDLWEDCAKHIGENLLVAVPSKDVVLMVGQSQTDALKEMKKIALEIVKDGDGTLTEHILLYDIVQKKFTIFSVLNGSEANDNSPRKAI